MYLLRSPDKKSLLLPFGSAGKTLCATSQASNLDMRNSNTPRPQKHCASLYSLGLYHATNDFGMIKGLAMADGEEIVLISYTSDQQAGAAAKHGDERTRTLSPL